MMEVRGVIGQFNSYQTALLDVAIGTRGGLNIVGSLKTNSATTNISVYCDLALYMESNSTYTLYLKTTGFYKFDVSVKGTGQGLSVFPPSNGAITASNFPSGSNVFYSIVPYLQQITVGGNFGILNSNPQYNLDVAGQGNATTLSESGTLISTKYAPSNALSNYVLTSSANSTYAPSNTLSNYVLTSTANSTYPSGWALSSGSTSTSCNVTITSSGGNPATSGLAVQSTANSANATVAILTNGSSGGSPYLSMYPIGLVGWSIGVDNSDSQKLKFVNNWNFSTSSTAMTLTSSGRLGINNTNSPAYPLDVNGQANATSLSESGILLSAKYAMSNSLSNYVLTSTANSTYPSGWTTGSGKTTTSCNVGIGSTSPAYALDVNGTTHCSNLLIGNNGTNDYNRMISALDSTISTGSGRYIALGLSNSTNNQVELTFNYTSNGSSNNYGSLGLYGGSTLYWTGYGRMGVQTSTPAYPLDVNGQANATSLSEAGTLLSTKYETTSAFAAFSNWISPLAGTGSNAGYGTIGTASIGNCGCNNYASFSYCNMNNSNNCALLQDSLGNTTISCSSNTSGYQYQNIILKQGQQLLAYFNTTSNFIFTPTSFGAPVNFNYAWNSNNPICLDLGLDNYSSLRIGATSFINPYGQIILCQSGGYFSHNIATRHASVDTTGTGNAIDFNIWSCNLGASATATYCSMSITACNVGINNKNPNTAYKLDVNGSVNINSNLNVVGNTNNYGYLFAGHNNGGGGSAGGGYIVAGNTFDTAGTTHTVNPLEGGSADNSSGICVIVAKNASTSSPKNGVMMLSWVKNYGSAQLQPSVFHTNTQGMSVFGASNNGANSITVYTDSGCSITYQTFAGC